jgi:hypothetical protein
MLSETQFMDKIASGEISFPPLQYRLVRKEVTAQEWYCDAIIDASWEDQSFIFAAEIRRYSSDQTVLEAIREARYAAEKLSALPLIITPWLSPEQLERLEAERVSGIDLSGNGIIVVPGRILIIRSGKANAYPDSRTVKNVYQGSTSLVARAFLIKASYDSVKELVEQIEARLGSITQPTVSKALKQLEEDVVIWREKGLIKLLQADKLLERLIDNFKLPQRKTEVTGKIDTDPAHVPALLSKIAAKAGEKIVVTGASSVGRYASMAREPIVEFYSSADMQTVLRLPGNPHVDLTSRFPNFRLIRTDDPNVFFDARLDGKTLWASPLQCYLELLKGDKREKETATKSRKLIFKGLDQLGPKVVE